MSKWRLVLLVTTVAGAFLLLTGSLDHLRSWMPYAASDIGGGGVFKPGFKDWPKSLQDLEKLPTNR